MPCSRSHTSGTKVPSRAVVSNLRVGQISPPFPVDVVIMHDCPAFGGGRNVFMRVSAAGLRHSVAGWGGAGRPPSGGERTAVVGWHSLHAGGA